jgi:CHAD domain-containing protein
VQLDHWSREKAPRRGLLQGLARSRRRFRKELKTALQKFASEDRFSRQAVKLVDKVRWRCTDTKPIPYGAFSRDSLSRLAHSFFEAEGAALADDEALHALRIAAKRWRYALELAAGVLRLPWAKELYNGLTDVQDRLGALRDQAAIAGRIEELLPRAHRKRRRLKLEDLVRREQAQLSQAREDLRRWWTPARRKQLLEQWEQAASAPDERASERASG